MIGNAFKMSLQLFARFYFCHIFIIHNPLTFSRILEDYFHDFMLSLSGVVFFTGYLGQETRKVRFPN